MKYLCVKIISFANTMNVGVVFIWALCLMHFGNRQWDAKSTRDDVVSSYEQSKHCLVMKYVENDPFAYTATFH